MDTWSLRDQWQIGNDSADRLAKEALDKPVIEMIVSSEAKDTFDAVDSYILDQWQKQWNDSITGALNKRIVPLVSCKSKYSSNSRYKEVMISRLRLGKCRLNYYLNVMKCHPTGLCDTCKVPETIEHFLIDCNNSNLCNVLRNKCRQLGIRMSLEALLNSDRLVDILFSHIKREI